jgi:hypothetical protein
LNLRLKYKKYESIRVGTKNDNDDDEL